MKKIKFILMIILIFIFYGCASSPLITDKYSKDKILVYGFFNIKDEGKDYAYWINWIYFKKIAPDTKQSHYSFISKMGNIFITFLDPGFYRLEEFSAFRSNKIIEYNIPMQGNGFNFEKPGLYYFGTFEINNKPIGWRKVTYDMNRIYFPTEEDIIVRILEITEKGCYWEGQLKKRLKQLRDWREYYEKQRKSTNKSKI